MGRRVRTYVWAAVTVEIMGLAIDALWHGVLAAEVEPQTRVEMVRHLASVHLVLYVGVAALFLTTAWALVDQVRLGGPGVASITLAGIAFAGATMQGIGEIWHAASHLHLQPNPTPELAGFVGLALAIVATTVAGRRARRLDQGARLEESPQGR
jgi:hypothetical protein